jgi:hypothetical protein
VVGEVLVDIKKLKINIMQERNIQAMSQEEINEMLLNEHANPHQLLDDEQELGLHEIRPSVIKTFQINDDPELVHLVKSGFKNMWFVFEEDAYQTEPFKSGIQFLSEQVISEKYGIDFQDTKA